MNNIMLDQMKPNGAKLDCGRVRKTTAMLWLHTQKRAEILNVEISQGFQAAIKDDDHKWNIMWLKLVDSNEFIETSMTIFKSLY